MTINELAIKLNAKIINLADGNREVKCGYCGDFLSNVMSKAGDNCMWFTVMNNVNVAAVACLSNVSVVVLCEGVEPDPQLLDKAKTQGVNVITVRYPIFEGCRMV